VSCWNESAFTMLDGRPLQKSVGSVSGLTSRAKADRVTIEVN